MHTYRPQYRDWAGQGERTVTSDEYFSVVDAIAERIVVLALQRPMHARLLGHFWVAAPVSKAHAR